MEYTYILVYLALQFSRVSPASLRDEWAELDDQPYDAQEALKRLSQVFELEAPPTPKTHHRTPPEYMVDLYNSIAEPVSGLTRARGPFDADVIRGLPDRDAVQQMHFQFNVSLVKGEERVLETELHLFKLRPRFRGDAWRRMITDRRPAHIVELRVYQVLEEQTTYQQADLRLLDYRRVSAHAHGWQVFKIGEAVAAWINGTVQNHGLLVTAHSLSGRPVNGSIVQFAQRGQHHDRIQPVLVVFSQDGKPHTRTFISPDEEREFKRQVAMLNEANWDTDDDSANDADYLSRRRRNSRRNRKHACAKHKMFVDFEKIGWSDWIISPKGYDAHQCRGDCPFPLGQNQKPTNHATVQSIVHALRIVDGVNTPCCVPNKLYSISLLYFDDKENVILKQYDDMVAATCGCH